MIPVLVNNPGLGSATRCGWLCRTLGKIANALDGLPLINRLSSGIRKIANDIQIFDGWLGIGDFTTGSHSTVFRTSQGTVPTDYPMIDVEAQILENWFDTYFNLWYQRLAASVNQSLSQPLTQKIQGINNSLVTICALKNYLQNYPKDGAENLSENTIKNRNSLIVYMLEQLEKLIGEDLKGTPIVNIQTSFSSVDLSGLGFSSAKLKTGACLNYSVDTKNESTIVNNPTQSTIVTQTPTTPQPGTQPGTPTGDIVEQGQNFVKKNWLWLAIAGFVGYKILK